MSGDLNHSINRLGFIQVLVVNQLGGLHLISTSVHSSLELL
ncbi:hypothetical protein HanPSC8_Chr16g0733611 [Helianthus annuus]|nr:hypothetical protein HanPSC8_Chr16g0733611 [Helianthus annuus]